MRGTCSSWVLANSSELHVKKGCHPWLKTKPTQQVIPEKTYTSSRETGQQRKLFFFFVQDEQSTSKLCCNHFSLFLLFLAGKSVSSPVVSCLLMTIERTSVFNDEKLQRILMVP